MQGGLNYDPGSGKGRSRPNSGGGEFISVHLRRADYIQARPGIILLLKLLPMMSIVSYYSQFYII